MGGVFSISIFRLSYMSMSQSSKKIGKYSAHCNTAMGGVSHREQNDALSTVITQVNS